MGKSKAGNNPEVASFVFPVVADDSVLFNPGGDSFVFPVVADDSFLFNPVVTVF